MTTVVYVHGTGVRKEAYDKSYDKVASALAPMSGVSVKPCYWGHLGSELHRGGASIPDYDSTRSLADNDDSPTTDEEYNVNLWGVLYEDPLYELRVLAVRQDDTAREWVPGQISPGMQLAERAKKLSTSTELRHILQRGEVDQEFEQAQLWVTSSKAYEEALDRAPAALDEYRAAIARAFIARASALAAQKDGAAEVARDPQIRDEIESVLVKALGGGEHAIGGWVKDQLSGLVCRLGSRYLGRHRGALTDAGYPATGDILLYQARGQEIRDFIRGCILDVSPPRVVLAHSLGGIACVDLLITEPTDIQLLVSVGSQAPFLYEINALQSLSFGKVLPNHFSRWLNIYDVRDFLSYVAEKVFPGRVRDVRVDNRQPFPASHSAYWSNKQVWTAIAEELR